MSIQTPSLEHIPAFHAVMSHGSLSAAARHLRLAQPTVRRHIEALEVELETQLFTRAANGLTPTAMAQTLLPLAQSVLEEAQALSRVASAHRDALEGIVRITTSRVVATHVLPAILAQIREVAPNIRLEIAATDKAENLARRAADIAIRFTPPRQLSLVALRLPDVEIGIFAAPEAGLAEDHDLATLPFISDDREDALLPAFGAAGLPVPQNIVLRCDDPLAQLAHLQAGVGAGVCQVRLADRLGLLRLWPKERFMMPMWLVVHEDQAGIARIRHVFDHLKQSLPEMM